MSLRVNRSLSIPLGEIELRTSTSSGPGGQHANRSQTRIEAIFRVSDSNALTETQKLRITERLGEVVVATAQDERSQLRNRELALQRLGEKLAQALYVPRSRRATRPTRSSKERRLAGKRVRGITKSNRRKPSSDE
ncbi:MAG: aminoacyl-tRNA hydrolase [Thermoleophilaceae bacterium]|nr:aminoacyl-tRNA hydrolase [Thermoleophilaceae bacterium]